MSTRLPRWSWPLLLVVFLSPVTLWGQEVGLDPAATPTPEPVSVAAPSVIAAPPTPTPAQVWPSVESVRSTQRGHPDRGGLGDAVILKINNLQAYLGGNQDACGSLILFLAEVPIPGSGPEACDPYTGEVRFELDRTAESDRAWHVLLAEPVSFTRTVSVSVGAQGRLAFPTKARFELEIVPAVEFVSYLIGLVLSILLAFYMARHTPILRDRMIGIPPEKAPYSLSRFQLAFWSCLVIAAYLFIWLITEELDTITGSVLTLLGIGSATALGAKIIDQGKTGEGNVSNPASPGNAAAPAAEIVPRTSNGFLKDVLSDSQGISLYRFQLFAWTLVLGVIFCASVYNGLEMPQFSTTLLGLMGISSGTYLGFKVPEAATSEPKG